MLKVGWGGQFVGTSVYRGLGMYAAQDNLQPRRRYLCRQNIPVSVNRQIRLNNKVAVPLVKPACWGSSIQPQPAIAALNSEAEGVVGSETEVLAI